MGKKQKQGGGGKKIGRNKKRCEVYKMMGKRGANKKRVAERVAKRAAKKVAKRASHAASV